MNYLRKYNVHIYISGDYIQVSELSTGTRLVIQHAHPSLTTATRPLVPGHWYQASVILSNSSLYEVVLGASYTQVIFYVLNLRCQLHLGDFLYTNSPIR